MTRVIEAGTRHPERTRQEPTRPPKYTRTTHRPGQSWANAAIAERYPWADNVFVARAVIATLSLASIVMGFSHRDDLKASVEGLVDVSAAMLHLGPTTGEQRLGFQQLEDAQYSQLFTHIVAQEVKDEEGRIVPIQLRNKPFTEDPEETFDHGKVVGALLSGDVVAKALVVVGGDPLHPDDRNAEGRWYEFFNPNNPGDQSPDNVVFAYVGNLDSERSPYLVEPVYNYVTD